MAASASSDFVISCVNSAREEIRSQYIAMLVMRQLSGDDRPLSSNRFLPVSTKGIGLGNPQGRSVS